MLKVRIKRDNLAKVKEDVEGSFTISPRSLASENLQLIPKCIVFGVGCRKGKAGSELIDFAKRVLEELSIDKRSIAAVTSIDLNRDEEGIIELAKELGVNPNTVSKAFGMLERDGIIYSVPGRGSFLSDDHGGIIKKNAEKEFRQSVEKALGGGLTKDELISIVNDTGVIK